MAATARTVVQGLVVQGLEGGLLVAPGRARRPGTSMSLRTAVV
ncbi:hypothetical protein ACQEVZ_27900 [Dactylosporangium sp. CA-152071]